MTPHNVQLDHHHHRFSNGATVLSAAWREGSHYVGREQSFVLQEQWWVAFLPQPAPRWKTCMRNWWSRGVTPIKKFESMAQSAIPVAEACLIARIKQFGQIAYLLPDPPQQRNFLINWKD